MITIEALSTHQAISLVPSTPVITYWYAGLSTTVHPSPPQGDEVTRVDYVIARVQCRGATLYHWVQKQISEKTFIARKKKMRHRVLSCCMYGST
jgi:hypothetical protein